MWVVGVGNDVYVRSAGGPDRPWYRHALASGAGHIRTEGGDIDVDATFVEAAQGAPHEAIDAAYRVKYDRYGPGPVGHVTGAAAHRVTVQLIPQEESTS